MRDVGWEAVKNSFTGVAGIAQGGHVEIKDQLIRTFGDLAYGVGVEQGELELAGHHVKIEQRVTNIYQLRDGQWKIVHHHSEISPAMVEILREPQ